MQLSQTIRVPWLVAAFFCAGCQMDVNGFSLASGETPEVRYFTLEAMPPSSIEVRVSVATYHDGHVMVGGDISQATPGASYVMHLHYDGCGSTAADFTLGPAAAETVASTVTAHFQSVQVSVFGPMRTYAVDVHRAGMPTMLACGGIG